jgi:hypothetical protein
LKRNLDFCQHGNPLLAGIWVGPTDIIILQGDVEMAKKQLVLALFANEAAADEAVNQLREWDKATEEVKLGAIGVLVKDEKGKIKSEKLGKRKTGTGAVLGALAVVLTGGMSLVGGVLLGGVLGSFFHHGLGMSKQDLARIEGELNGGKAAVGILAEPNEAELVSIKLGQLGGTAETHDVVEETVGRIEEAVINTAE